MYPNKPFKINWIFRWITKALTFMIFFYGLINASTGLYRYFYDLFFRNNNLYSKLETINTGTNVKYVDALIGEPFLIRNLPKSMYDFEKEEEIETRVENLSERIYSDTKFYLQVISRENDEIVAYSITTRDRNFNPAIPLVLYHLSGDGLAKERTFRIKIGESTFGDLKDYTPERIGFGMLNQHTFYLEDFYYGRMGGYKNYFFGISPYGLHYSESLYDEMIQLAFAYLNGEKNIENNQEYTSWREQDKINTFAIIGLDNQKLKKHLEDYFFAYGIGPTVDVIYNLN